jgi:hypothetical protein
MMNRRPGLSGEQICRTVRAQRHRRPLRPGGLRHDAGIRCEIEDIVIARVR